MKNQEFPVELWRIVAAIVVLWLTVALSARATDAPASDRMPITTTSAEARQLFDRGIAEFENMHLERANATMREAVKLDPKFALAHLMLTFRNSDPVESNRAAARAKGLVPYVSDGEKLMIQWLTGVHQGNPVQAIAALNDLLGRYPRDIHLAWLAGVWAQRQQQYERSVMYFERALSVDPNFAGALNELGYAYADMNRFDEAFSAMQRYVKLLPKEPNPEDSYAEILRMAGRFDEALVHYRAALAIDPEFIGSMLGIADTLAFQDKGKEAREAYAKLLQVAPRADTCGYRQQAALTYVREKSFVEADAEFRAIAAQAHEWGLGFCEAESYRLSSMYQQDPYVALELLVKAEAAVAQASEFTPRDHDLAKALILQQLALRYAALNDSIFAKAALQALASLAERSRNESIQNISEGTTGAVLLGERKFAEAIPHLEADANDPSSRAGLAMAYLKTGNVEGARAAVRRLITRYLPTMEDALVASHFRVQATDCRAGVKNDLCAAFGATESAAPAK